MGHWKKDPRDAMLLAVKMEEEPRNAGCSELLEKASRFSSRVSRKECSRPTPWFEPSEACVGLPTYRTTR